MRYQDYEQEEHWNIHYSKESYAALNYDGWLEKYLPDFPENAQILDLGCGTGSDTDRLLREGFSVVSVDFSEEALQTMKKLVPDAKTFRMDMTMPFPFEDNRFDVLIADLSLHYFEWDLTEKILAEIKRVLKEGGMIAVRVNSDKDYSFGAGEGVCVEKGLFVVDGRLKRFFTQDDVQRLFRGWSVKYMQENVTSRYLKSKAYWEIGACKIGE